MTKNQRTTAKAKEINFNNQFLKILSIMLSSSQRKHLRGLAHNLEPVVRVGQKGLTDSVLGETAKALQSHELIKVRLDAEGSERKTLAAELAEKAEADLAGVVGKIAILYKANDEKPKIKLPRA